MAKPKTRGRRVLPVSVRVAALALVALNCSCDLCDFLLILAGSDPSDPPVDCHHLEWVAVESLTFPPVHRSMTRLLPAGVAAADRFGAAIAIDGDTIVVGAPGYDSHLRPSYAGAAYVFTKSSDSTWTQTAALTASDPHIGSLFGAAVAVSPDLIAVGAPGTDAGAVYVFRRSGGTWTEVDRLSGAGPADRFGAAVALDGSRLAVGAPLHIPSGEVYVYTEEQPDTWTSRDQLYGPELGHVAGDYFGASLDLRGDWLAAGAPGYPGSNLTAGACHVFHREADGFWYLSTDLTSMIERRPTTNADQFGAAVRSFRTSSWEAWSRPRRTGPIRAERV